MKTLARIPAILRQNVGENVFLDLSKIYPEGSQRHLFRSFLPLDDERSLLIIERLARAGLNPWWDRSHAFNGINEYVLEIERQYEECDLMDCEYLELSPPIEAFSISRGARAERKSLAVYEDDLADGDFDLRADQAYSYFVPSRVQRILIQDHFNGLSLRRVCFIPHDATSSDTNSTIEVRHGMPFWELDSDRTMPPLSSSMLLIDTNENIVKPGFPGTCHPRCILGVRPELRYKKNDLVAMNSFDVARTYERFQPFGMPGDRPLIVSRRFYDYWIKLGLKTGWVPVRID